MGRDVVVVGESLVDVIVGADGSRAEHAGGSAANAALALARLEVPVRLATSWGPDERGAELEDHLGSQGVALLGDPVVLASTSTAHASVDADGAARYEFDVTWDLPSLPDGAPPAVLLLSSLAPLVEPGASKVRGLLDAWPRTRVVYDLNIRAAITGTGHEVVAAVESVAARSHLVKASDEDLRALWPELGLVAAAHRLLRLGARTVVITRGRAGALWVQQGRLVAEPAVLSDQVVDTIGAGDTFGAALVTRLLETDGDGCWTGWEETRIRAALAWAAAAAAVTVSRAGADPPTRDEVEAARDERDGVRTDADATGA